MEFKTMFKWTNIVLAVSYVSYWVRVYLLKYTKIYKNDTRNNVKRTLLRVSF